jgi:CheY-like chemotaxis protein
MEQQASRERVAQAVVPDAGATLSPPASPLHDELLPDLILIDLNLPQVSGLELLQTFRGSEALRGVKMVVLSGSDAPSDRDASLNLGAELYLRKPADLAAFDRVGETIVSLLTP